MKVLREEFDTLVKEMNKQVSHRDKERSGEGSRVAERSHKDRMGHH